MTRGNLSEGKLIEGSKTHAGVDTVTSHEAMRSSRKAASTSAIRIPEKRVRVVRGPGAENRARNAREAIVPKQFVPRQIRGDQGVLLGRT